MQTKLTLRLDEKLIKRAKNYAEGAGKSLSQVVAEYFAAITSSKQSTTELTPNVSKLKGVLKGTKIDSQDYRAYLEEKYR